MKKKEKEKRETQAKRLKVKYLAHSFHKSKIKYISIKKKKKKKKKKLNIYMWDSGSVSAKAWRRNPRVEHLEWNANQSQLEPRHLGTFTIYHLWYNRNEESVLTCVNGKVKGFPLWITNVLSPVSSILERLLLFRNLIGCGQSKFWSSW